ncbi:MAG: hypothetical protein NC300_05305 [Bacteroidales bacterium]|nr:hypothetical protein [Clostridium sp.]MCM1203541.1 hypothetical protein [Bacteroidales bacterium]
MIKCEGIGNRLEIKKQLSYLAKHRKKYFVEKRLYRIWVEEQDDEFVLIYNFGGGDYGERSKWKIIVEDGGMILKRKITFDMVTYGIIFIPLGVVLLLISVIGVLNRRVNVYLFLFFIMGILSLAIVYFPFVKFPIKGAKHFVFEALKMRVIK